MKKLLSLILIVFNFYANAQETETELTDVAEKYLDEYYQNWSEVESTMAKEFLAHAYDSFSLLVEKFPDSKKYTYYLYSKGCTTKNKEEAKLCFEKVIQNNDWGYYTRKSHIILVSYAIDNNDFKTALFHLNEIEKMGKPTFTCGTEMDSYNAQIANLYERYNQGVKK